MSDIASNGATLSATESATGIILNGNTSGNGNQFRGLRPHKRGDRTNFVTQRPLKQAVAIQNILFDSISGKRKTKSSEASLARAWADIEERRRILMGKPLPGVLRPEAKPRKQRQSSTPSPIRRPQVVPFEQPQTPQDNSACGV